jgi:hypothetical protein
MATGVLGKAAPAAATNVTVYTVPASVTATVNISVCNTGTALATIRLALAAAATPAAGEYIEYGMDIPPGGSYERAGLVLAATQRVVVYSSVAGLNVVVYGFEE